MLRLIRAARGPRDRALLGLLGLLGLRAFEAAKVQVEDVDLELRLLRLVGKGHKAATLPLAQPLYGLVRDQMEALPYKAGPLFPSRKAAQLTRKGVWYLVKRTAEAAGLDPAQVWPHLCRHAFVSHVARRKGVDVARDLARHESLATTTIYVSISAEALREGVEDLWTL